MQKTVAEIAGLLGGEVAGDGSVPIAGVNGILQAVEGDLTFVSKTRYVPYIATTRASAVLVRERAESGGKPLILVGDPYAAAARVAALFAPPPAAHPSGIHPMAVVAEDAQLGANVALGAHAFVGRGSVLSEGVIVYPGAYVGEACRIGPGTVIYANASLYDHVSVGARCIIHSGAVIGSEGFGYYFAHGAHQKIPQLGQVILEDDVEVGANSAIDRATFGRTVIGRGTKIDNLVQIGHNAEVGEHCILCGMVGLAGSTVLGDRVTLAAGAGVAGHLEIGSGATVTGRAGVTKSIPAGKVVSGYPATDHETERRILASRRRLPEMVRQVRALEQRVAELESRLDGKTENNR